MFKSCSKIAVAASIIATTLFSSSITVHAASVVKTTAYVNLLSGPDLKDASGINPVVTSEASSGDGRGHAFAKAEATGLKSQASSSDLFLSYPAFGSSVFENSYRIDGNPNNLALPLTFNFSLTGNLSVETSSGKGGSVALGSFSYKVVNYDFSQNAAPPFYSETFGNLGITSQGGFIVYLDQGGFLGKNSLGALITPTISVGADIKKLTPEILKKAGIPEISLKISPDKFTLKELETRQSLLYGNIANALNILLPSLNIPLPGEGKAKIGIGADVSYFFDSKIELPQLISNNGRLDAQLTAIANSSTGGKADSNFGSTLQLQSITVPNTFNALDIDNLKIFFDSGDVFPVLRAAEAEPTPIPTPALLPGLVCLGLKILRQKKCGQA